MRLLYLITRAEPGGAQVHVLELLRGFRGRAELHLGVGEDRHGFLIEEARALGIGVHILKQLLHPIRPHRDLLGLWEVAALLKRLSPHLVHAHSSKAGFLGRLAARALGVKSVYTAHGWAFTEGVPEGRRRLALAMERLAGRLGDRVIAVSRYDRDLALRHRVVSPQKLRVVWNGVPETPLRARPEAHPPRLVMVARFAPPKDHALLLRALAGLRELPWTLDLVGEGPLLPQAQALARALGLAERVRFLGARRDVAEVLAQAQVFVLATHWEGLPLSVLEAMRAGLPVVATDVGGVGEAVVEGNTGFLVGRGDEVGLRRKLSLLLENPSLRASMGEAGRRRYEEAFTLERMLLETWRVYEDVLVRGGSPVA
ncbi:glycosyltransferase family 4 protein [Thermus islandicus]|uniref:glycosyltransferase family 4 protein n=1 Tax=Thermus islandicus TaxID=540988 RepID=UPI0003B5E113|nr:glycosyltransferase family 4 protein [Thermus islandicus]